ncbi:MAG: O-antigen polymerase [Microbacter sp.]
MIVIPFVSFSLLLIYYYRKYGLNIASFLLILYTLVFGAAIPLYYGFDKYSDVHPSFYSMIYLVLMIFIWLLPILHFSSREYSISISFSSHKFNVLSYVLIISGFLTYAFLLPNGIKNVTSGDISYIRNAAMQGNIDIYSDNDAVNFIISNLSIFYPLSLLFFFYSMAFLSKKRTFNILLFLSSTSVLVISLLYVARGDIVYWALMYLFLYLLFRKYIDQHQRRKIILPFLIALALGIIYFSVVSVARFENYDYGPLFGILDYWGQPAINFGDYFEHFTVFQHGTLNFPFVQRIMGLPHREGVVQYFDYASTETGFYLGVFYTFIGSFFIDFGLVGTTLLVVAASILGFILFRQSEEIPMYKLILMVIYCQVPLQGLFIFNLLNDNGNKYIFLMLLISVLLRFKIGDRDAVE